RNSLLSEFECMFGIEHDRHFFRARGALARHDRARVWAVRNSARMQRNRSRLNTPARPKIAAHVKQNFVGFDVVVHPGNFYSFRMGIEQPGRESAYHVSANFKCLMDRRRLVNRARDRLEVLRVKCEGIYVAVPANNIEWMMSHRHLSPARTVLH